jgi:hypothetical protein
MQISRQHVRFLLPFVGLVITAIIYFLSGWARVSSVMNVGTTAFSISYLVLVFLGLFFLFDYLKRVSLWRSVLAGIVVGYLASLVSYYIAVLSMPDGVTRLTNSVSLMGWSAFLVTLWGLVVLLCWSWSAVGFLLMSGLAKQLNAKE